MRRNESSAPGIYLQMSVASFADEGEVDDKELESNDGLGTA